MSKTTPTRGGFFSRPEVARHAKDMQLRHWKIILSGGFTDEYEQSVRKIGFTHYRLGLEPRLYIGGYNFAVTGLCEAIAARMPLSRFDRDAGKKRASLQSAVIRAAILDMDLSQSVYLEAMEQARRSDLQKVAADLQVSIAETAASVRSTAEALQQNAHRMNETAKTTVAQAQAADAAAALTAANVNAVSAATTQLSYSVSEIGQQTRRSHEIAESSAQAAKKSEEMIGHLARAAEQIGGFVGMINAIAGKTNMLALNATIEAARAGEAGRGFAVVASEVKALAEQTARATAEIGEKISAIQASTQLFAENIDLIARTTEETSSAATGIAAAVEQQGRRDPRNHPEHHRSIDGRRWRRGKRPGGRARRRRRYRSLRRSFGGVAAVDATGRRPHVEYGAFSSVPERGLMTVRPALSSPASCAAIHFFNSATWPASSSTNSAARILISGSSVVSWTCL